MNELYKSFWSHSKELNREFFEAARERWNETPLTDAERLRAERLILATGTREYQEAASEAVHSRASVLTRSAKELETAISGEELALLLKGKK